MKGHCILSHGFESGPDATKVTALADAAERLGWSHERPDYSDLDAKREVSPLGDVMARLQRLQQIAHAASTHGPLVLAGSSLGAWISARVSLEVPVRGLFLMAPPIEMRPAPVMEAASVILQVASFKTTGRRIFKCSPLHHHFELKGWPEPRVIVRFWIITIILVLIGLATLKIR